MGRSRRERLRVGGISASGDLEGDLESVVGEADVGRELGFDGAVVGLVAHVGEEGTAGFELFDECDRFVEMRVAGMRLAAGGAGKEGGGVLQEGEALFR